MDSIKVIGTDCKSAPAVSNPAMNISFLTSGHYPFDDRIFYHMARSLSDNGNTIEIVSSKTDLKQVTSGISLNCFEGDALPKKDKISQFEKRLSEFTPDVIICSEPLPLLAAKRYSKRQNKKVRIIYDITEWSPSGKNVIGFKIPIRWIIFLKLLLFNYYASSLADAFIFGERFKSKPYRFIFPFKKFCFTTYYPNLKYLRYNEPEIENGKLRLTYSGKISLEKGYRNFFNVLKRLAEYKPDLKIEVKIVGWYESPKDKEDIEKLSDFTNNNITLLVFDRQSFENYVELIKDTDIFLDLRSDNFENQHCLPIKIFYYAALKRPVIISDLKSVRKDVEIDKFGFVVKPTDEERIVKLITCYLEDRDLYNKHCENARHLAKNKYNWEKTEAQFLKFVTS